MGPNRPLPSRGGALPIATRGADRYFELKSQIHRKLIGVLNLERASSIPKDRIRTEIGRVVERLLDEERVPMTTAEQTKIVEEVLDEVLGLGPLETLLKEPSISDILVNRYNKVFIERNGKLSETAVTPSDCSMQNATASEYDGSLPSSVMSVPCKVVITLGGT